MLLDTLKLRLPDQPPPKIAAAQVRAQGLALAAL